MSVRRDRAPVLHRSQVVEPRLLRASLHPIHSTSTQRALLAAILIPDGAPCEAAEGGASICAAICKAQAGLSPREGFRSSRRQSVTCSCPSAAKCACVLANFSLLKTFRRTVCAFANFHSCEDSDSAAQRRFLTCHLNGLV